MERICAGVRSDESRDPSDTDRRILSLLVEHLYLHRLVPKPVFFELAETTKRKREDAQADYDKHYRHPPLPFDSRPHCAKVRLWDGRHLRESC
jgi:hypothetical protein